jgi:outer membrane autotransporter protein
MQARALRQQLLLSTTMVMGTLTGYGGRAYADCVNSGGSTYSCSGSNAATQANTANDATVTTVPGFSVTTATGDAVTITGDGALSFTDVNASALTATEALPTTAALDVRATGDVGGGNAGSVTINTNGALTGYANGIYARNDGSGLLSITTGGDVAGNVGIKARTYGDGLDLTTGAGTTVTGGVYVDNNAGVATVVINGDSVGGEFGILARNLTASTDMSVTTAAGTTVSGDQTGIGAVNTNGALTVTTNGDVTGTTRGILAVNYGGTDLSVTTGTGTTVTATDDSAIEATNNGSGKLDIAINGDVTSGSTGIRAVNQGAGGMSVTTAAGTTVTAGGGGSGMYVESFSGAMTIGVNGDVLGDEQGILAKNMAATALSVTTAAGTTVSGEDGLVAATFYGTETLRIAVNGDVAGTSGGGLVAGHAGGGAIEVSVGKASHVTSSGDPKGFAVYTTGGPASITIAGTLSSDGVDGGAVRFDQTIEADNRLTLHPTATVNGNVLAGPGSGDTLAFGGTGTGTFDLSNIDTGANTKQYQNFEIFEVDSGTWSFSGATAQDFAVEGGTLKGTGTFGALTVNGGTLAPGNSIGTMRVNGAFTIGSGAVYEVEVDAAGRNDKVIVNGSVNLTGATLRVLAASGTYKPDSEYVIIENDGSDAVNGEFARVTANLAFLSPTVIYDGGTGNDVVLVLLPTGGSVDFCSVAETRNECNVADALGQFPTDNALFLAVLNQTEEGARQAFDALSGEIHATVAGTLADDSRYVREAVLGRLMQASHSGEALSANGPQVASLDSSAMALGYGFDGKSLVGPEPAPLAFWTRAYGAWGDFDGDGNAATAKRDLGGFVSGMDANIGGSWRVGLATGASFSNVDVSDRYSSADVDSYTLGGYAGGMAGSFALRGGGMWAWSGIDTSRAVVFPGFYERQKASYDADTGQLFGEVAYPTQLMGMALEPFGGLAVVSIDTDNFRERGGALASLRGSTDQDVSYSTLGFRAATVTQFGGMAITPNLSVAWLHAFSGVTPEASLAFASTGIGFAVDGVPLARDSALIDAGLDFALGENTTAGVSYTGQFGDGVQDNGVKGRFTWLF